VGVTRSGVAVSVAVWTAGLVLVLECNYENSEVLVDGRESFIALHNNVRQTIFVSAVMQVYYS
jgi:hypothetical protein